MRNSQNAMTILVVVFVAIFLGILDWFFLVGPKVSATSDAKSATEAQLVTNGDLEILLAKRKADSAKLPELREALWSIRDQFPPNVDASTVRDELSALDAKYGIFASADSIGVPVDVVAGASLAPALAVYGLDPYADTLTFTSLAAIPITLTLQGSYEQVTAYLDDLQMGEHRYFLITSLAVTAVAEDPAANPPVAAGDIQVAISGLFYSLDHGLAGLSTRPAPEPFPGIEPLPSEVTTPPSAGRNFFVPAS